MKKYILVLLSFAFTSMSYGSTLDTYFASKQGDWALVSGWTKGINEDGSTGSESTSTVHNTSISNRGIRWTESEDFCSITEGIQYCGLSSLVFEIEENVLYVVDQTMNSRIPVEVRSSSSNSLDIRYILDGLTFEVSEKISSKNLYTKIIQVLIGDQLLKISFISSEKERF